MFLQNDEILTRSLEVGESYQIKQRIYLVLHLGCEQYLMVKNLLANSSSVVTCVLKMKSFHTAPVLSETRRKKPKPTNSGTKPFTQLRVYETLHF